MSMDCPGMGKKWLYTIVVLLVSAISMHAQEHVEKTDTVSIKPKPFPVIVSPLFSNTWKAYYLSPDPVEMESKEQRAARINQETFYRVMASVNQNLNWYRPPALSNTEMALLFVAGLFLTSPYKFQPGTVPLMNASNPFMFAVTPGGAPYVYPYSSDTFPQCIRTEYDFKSGTYQQVMVKWDDVEESMTRSFGGPYRNDPVPRMQFLSTDKLIP